MLDFDKLHRDVFIHVNSHSAIATKGYIMGSIFPKLFYALFSNIHLGRYVSIDIDYYG